MSMTLIDRVELSGSAVSIDFTNIPQTYTDLQLVFSGRLGVNDANWRIGFNGVTTGYTERVLVGNGSIAGSYGRTNGEAYNFIYLNTSAYTASTFSSVNLYVPNYASTTIQKTTSIDGVSETNGTNANQYIHAGTIAGTAAITSIKLYYNNASGDIAAGSTASLYGISRQSAIGKPKAIGGAITFANGFWYHKFTGSGTFSVQSDVSVEALVIAGGGGGTGAYGGAGAGGALYSSVNLLAKTDHLVGVGAGGSGANVALGSSGVNSSFDSSIAIGGGGGAADANGRSGGSGGGAGGPGYSVGAGTANQGNNGGLGAGVSGYQAGGGGGGAGAVGGNAAGNQNGGNGGAGTGSFAAWAYATSTGVNGYYAGGGGGAAYGNGGTSTGGSGGSGGGGQGAAQVLSSYAQHSTAGTANTGSGGGSGMNESGSNGGSGLVIIRYPVD
jgi:hypothetical protein